MQGKQRQIAAALVLIGAILGATCDTRPRDARVSGDTVASTFSATSVRPSDPKGFGAFEGNPYAFRVIAAGLAWSAGLRPTAQVDTVNLRWALLCEKWVVCPTSGSGSDTSTFAILIVEIPDILFPKWIIASLAFDSVKNEGDGASPEWELLSSSYADVYWKSYQVLFRWPRAGDVYEFLRTERKYLAPFVFSYPALPLCFDVRRKIHIGAWRAMFSVEPDSSRIWIR